MRRGRLEAFSDGVIAIIITIMALELKIPEGHEFSDLRPMIPVFASYVMSFLYVAIYWNNHHHLMHTVEQVNGRILWANMALLFALSLTPATTAWMGESHFAKDPTMLYGAALLGAAIGYQILTWAITSTHGPKSKLAHAIGEDWKGKTSLWLYLAGIAAAYSLSLS